MSSATLRNIVGAARERLRAAGIEAGEAAMDAALLARHALGWDQARMIVHEIEAAPEGFSGEFERLVTRRARREPISSIVGRREFHGLEFEVGPDVLAPRPETEIIVDEAMAVLRGAAGCAGRDAGPADDEPPLYVDVGTGSGCLAVSLAVEFPEARLIATDVSPRALAVAARNAARHGVAARIDFRHASLLDGVPGPAALLVSNPPYIPAADIEDLDPEVRDWEPRVAIDGGPDGLDLVRALLAAAPAVLAPGGWFVMEFGFGQAEAVERLVRESPLELARLVRDLQGIPRTVVARKAVGSRQ